MAPCPLLFFLFFITFSATITTPTSSLPAFFPRAAYQSLIKQVETPKPKIPFKTHYFPQTLDHFTFQPASSKIFYQKYLINSRYWHKGAPIFVYTGNEGDIDWFAANTGFMLDIAPKFKALLVFIEHRFYGESLPFGKDSYHSAKTLGYLNSQQALADFAVLIRSLKQNLTSEASPVVVFGGSYGGMLAAWFRLKYPHIAIGALASSAPILQFDNIIPWSSFYDAVSQDFKDVSWNCYEVIKGSWAELEAISTEKEALAELSKAFRSCKSLHSVASARDWLWTAFVYTAMVNYPTDANFLKPLPAYPVQQMCKIIDKFPFRATKLSRTIAAASLYYNYSRAENCFEIEHEVDPHGLHGWEWQIEHEVDPHGLHGWDWQMAATPKFVQNLELALSFLFNQLLGGYNFTCTEMVMPMICSKESMFPPSSFDYEEFAEQCQMKYGVLPRPHWITTEFGGERMEKVLKRFGGNIIFSNGMQDPWSRGGVLKNISASILALVTEKGAHHVDFRAATKDDPDWLIEQRRLEVEIIQKWLNEYYADLRHA